MTDIPFEVGDHVRLAKPFGTEKDRKKIGLVEKFDFRGRDGDKRPRVLVRWSTGEIHWIFIYPICLENV